MAVSISRRSQGPKWVKDLKKKLPKLATSVIALLIFLAIWQILCFSPDAPLPSPTKVVSDTWELIINPFFNNGGRQGRVWIRIFPDLPVSAKPIEVRMGKGKGSTDRWVSKVKPGRIMFEVDGVAESIAREALRLGAMKLPVTTRIVAKEDW